MPIREVQTCTRCRDSKRRCDKSRPSCSRCRRAGLPCAYEAPETPIGTETGTTSSSSSRQHSPLSREAAPGKPIRTRDRATLSCIRCHRLKVKCDKRQPCCSRCARLGYGSNCAYTHAVQKVTGPKTSFISEGEDPQTIISLWFLRKRGSSHWKALLSRIEALTGLGDPPFDWVDLAVRSHLAGDCSKDLTLPGNFPFGSIESFQYRSSDEVWALLSKHRAMAPTFLEVYFNLHHVHTQFFDRERLQGEVDRFWETSKMNLGWLAQYLAILGLGAAGTGMEDKAVAEFFFASEACLAQTPYIFRPTMTDLRTLLLLVQAKQSVYASCWALDACWNIIGLVVRLSIMLGLHRSYMSEPDKMPAIFEERDQRTRVWNAIVKMDIQLSLLTGQGSSLPPDAFLTNALDNISGTPSSSRDITATVFPIVYEIISRLNATMDMISYDEVLMYDTQVRQIMRQALDAADNEGYEFRAITDIFFRRVLMVLHRSYALDFDAPILYSTSYWSSLECCLALIIQRQSLSGECALFPNNSHLIGKPFMLDFYAAAFTTCIHLMSTDAPLSANPSAEGTLPPRRIILETLQSCVDIFAKESGRSVCFNTGHRLLSVVYSLVDKGLEDLT